MEVLTLIPQILVDLLKYFLYGLAVLLGIFLFFRAARRELIADSDIFDIVLISCVSGLFFGRVSDFLFFPVNYNFSPVNLIFITTYGGFNFVGGALGAFFGVLFYLKKRKEKLWFVFDLAASPVVFSMFVISVIKVFFGKEYLTYLQVRTSQHVIFAIYFLILFWILKRLEKKKKHHGFFACFFLISLGLSYAMRYFINADKVYLWGNILYYPLIAILILLSSGVTWYMLSGRKTLVDLRTFFAFGLLFVFTSKRILTSSEEAGKFAKHIFLFPYFLVRSLLLASKFLCREIALGFFDFLTVFKTKK